MNQIEHRQMPISLEAEQALIGTVLMSSDAYEAAQFIRPEDFHEDIHQRVWMAIEAIAREGATVTPISVRALLPNSDLGDGMTLQGYLARLAASALAGNTALETARLVRQIAQRRRVIGLGQDLLDAGFNAPPGTKPQEIATSAIDALDAIVLESGGSIDRGSLGLAADMALEAARAGARGEMGRGVKTGLDNLDSIIGPLMPGNSIIIGGRPGMGKTALAVQIAMNVARAGDGVIFFSIEMPQNEVGGRAISNQLYTQAIKIPYNIIRSGRERTRFGEDVAISESKLRAMEDAAQDLNSLPFHIDASSEITLSQIKTRALRIKARFRAKGIRLGLVIIDYLSLIKAMQRDPSREREVAEISKGIKGLAKAIDAPVITLAQLRRQIEERKLDERRPQIADFRESGSIEQDADVLIGLYRKEYYLQQDGGDVVELDKVKDQLEAGVLKSRHSGINKALLRCRIAYNYIEDFAAAEYESMSPAQFELQG